MTTHSTDDITIARLLHREVLEWFLAIQLQNDRLNQDRLLSDKQPFKSGVRYYLMAWYVFDLVTKKASEFTNDSSVISARAASEDARTDIKKLRDIVSHIDDYIMGTGKMQTTRSGVPALFTALPMFTYPREIEHKDSKNCIVVLYGPKPFIEVDFSETTQLARSMHETVRSAFEKLYPEVLETSEYRRP